MRRLPCLWSIQSALAVAPLVQTVGGSLAENVAPVAEDAETAERRPVEACIAQCGSRPPISSTGVEVQKPIAIPAKKAALTTTELLKEFSSSASGVVRSPSTEKTTAKETSTTTTKLKPTTREEKVDADEVYDESGSLKKVVDGIEDPVVVGVARERKLEGNYRDLPEQLPVTPNRAAMGIAASIMESANREVLEQDFSAYFENEDGFGTRTSRAHAAEMAGEQRRLATAFGQEIVYQNVHTRGNEPVPNEVNYHGANQMFNGYVSVRKADGCCEPEPGFKTQLQAKCNFLHHIEGFFICSPLPRFSVWPQLRRQRDFTNQDSPAAKMEYDFGNFPSNGTTTQEVFDSTIRIFSNLLDQNHDGLIDQVPGGLTQMIAARLGCNFLYVLGADRHWMHSWDMTNSITSGSSASPSASPKMWERNLIGVRYPGEKYYVERAYNGQPLAEMHTTDADLDPSKRWTDPRNHYMLIPDHSYSPDRSDLNGTLSGVNYGKGGGHRPGNLHADVSYDGIFDVDQQLQAEGYTDEQSFQTLYNQWETEQAYPLGTCDYQMFSKHFLDTEGNMVYRWRSDWLPINGASSLSSYFYFYGAFCDAANPSAETGSSNSKITSRAAAAAFCGADPDCRGFSWNGVTMATFYSEETDLLAYTTTGVVAGVPLSRGNGGVTTATDCYVKKPNYAGRSWAVHSVVAHTAWVAMLDTFLMSVNETRVDRDFAKHVTRMLNTDLRTGGFDIGKDQSDMNNNKKPYCTKDYRFVGKNVAPACKDLSPLCAGREACCPGREGKGKTYWNGTALCPTTEQGWSWYNQSSTSVLSDDCDQVVVTNGGKWYQETKTVCRGTWMADNCRATCSDLCYQAAPSSPDAQSQYGKDVLNAGVYDEEIHDPLTACRNTYYPQEVGDPAWPACDVARNFPYRTCSTSATNTVADEGCLECTATDTRSCAASYAWDGVSPGQTEVWYNTALLYTQAECAAKCMSDTTCAEWYWKQVSGLDGQCTLGNGRCNPVTSTGTMHYRCSAVGRDANALSTCSFADAFCNHNIAWRQQNWFQCFVDGTNMQKHCGKKCGFCGVPDAFGAGGITPEESSVQTEYQLYPCFTDALKLTQYLYQILTFVNSRYQRSVEGTDVNGTYTGQWSKLSDSLPDVRWVPGHTPADRVSFTKALTNNLSRQKSAAWSLMLENSLPVFLNPKTYKFAAVGGYDAPYIGATIRNDTHDRTEEWLARTDLCTAPYDHISIVPRFPVLPQEVTQMVRDSGVCTQFGSWDVEAGGWLPFTGDDWTDYSPKLRVSAPGTILQIDTVACSTAVEKDFVDFLEGTWEKAKAQPAWVWVLAIIGFILFMVLCGPWHWTWRHKYTRLRFRCCCPYIQVPVYEVYHKPGTYESSDDE